MIIGIGPRFTQMLTGGKLEHFGRAAKKVMVDIDKEELTKFEDKGLDFDEKVHADLRNFLPQFVSALDDYVVSDISEWLRYVNQVKSSFPLCIEADYESKDEVDANVFIDALSLEAKEGDIIITDAGGNLTWTMQGFKTKEDQRLFSAWNHSPMGYSLAGAIGAAFANPGKDIICIIGDGGLQMCAEELATVARYDLPIKIFIFNNQGHGIQKQTIETWLDGRYEALDKKTGLFFPDFAKLADAYSLPVTAIASHANIRNVLKEILGKTGPVVIDVAINPDQRIRPMLTFGRPLEDQGPVLPREQFLEHMLIDPLPESLTVAEATASARMEAGSNVA